MSSASSASGKICIWTIIPTLICAIVSIVPLILYEKQSADFLNAFFNWYKEAFGSFYLVLEVIS